MNDIGWSIALARYFEARNKLWPGRPKPSSRTSRPL